MRRGSGEGESKHRRQGRELAQTRHPANFYTTPMRLSSAATVGILLGWPLMRSPWGAHGRGPPDKPATPAKTTSVPPRHTATPRSSCRRLRPLLGSMTKLRDDL